MSDQVREEFDPIEEMHAFYRQDDPTEEQQFRFVEAMKTLIDNAYWESDIIAFSYNLAIYYRDIREFALEKKYLELAAAHGSDVIGEELGIVWYYGLAGERDYEKAYRYFSECDSIRSRYMIADMYRYGQYVGQDREKSREILEELFDRVEGDKNDPRFALSTLFPEVTIRLVELYLEDFMEDGNDWNNLIDARLILTERQKRRPFWGNIDTMRAILEAMVEMREFDYGLIDLYDLLTFDRESAEVTFAYQNRTYSLKIFPHEGESVYAFQDRWFHGPGDFLEKARIGGKRVTTVIDQIDNIQAH